MSRPDPRASGRDLIIRSAYLLPARITDSFLAGAIRTSWSRWSVLCRGQSSVRQLLPTTPTRALDAAA